MLVGKEVVVNGPFDVRCPIQSEKRPKGTIARAEAEEAYRNYASRYGDSQSFERLHERGGFGYFELTELLGHVPTTWEPR